MDELSAALIVAFKDVRQFLLNEGRLRLGIVQHNARGDITKEFDFQAEERIIATLTRALDAPVRVLTEERGEVRTRPGSAACTVIVDPVDGSENFARDSELSSVSLALLPGEGEPRVEDVSHALVGHIYTGSTYLFTRTGATERNHRPVQTSGITSIEEAVIAIDLKFRERSKVAIVEPLLGRVKDVRRYGTAAGEIAAVAHGGVDAYIDVRGTLSPENWMAAVPIVLGAGGVASDLQGLPLAPIRSMTQGQSLVVAGNPTLHARLLEILNPA